MLHLGVNFGDIWRFELGFFIRNGQAKQVVPWRRGAQPEEVDA